MALWSGPVCRVSDELLFGIASRENIAAEHAAHAREGSAAQNVDAWRRKPDEPSRTPRGPR
jgi:hypothetical protein